MERYRQFTLGALPQAGNLCRFRVWAPKARKVELHLVHPAEKRIALSAVAGGYFEITLPDVSEGSRYFYRLDDGDDRPDPASRYQPDGVHGASAVVSREFAWQDSGWLGIPIDQHIFYELHAGTFTPEGTFEAIIPRLKDLCELGITTIELMPIAQFPGARNWGYDGVQSYAAQNSYGGPLGLRRLVDAAHREGLAVALDVVYNHIGPEGNYLGQYAPYFTDRYRTPWGEAINFDGPYSDEVRRYFIENALHWVTDFHIDALRLDAVHAIFDNSAYPFLEELGEAVQERARETGRHIAVIAESGLNDARLLRPQTEGGFDLDGQWSDDFHHALRTVLTGDRAGYYQDFGDITHLAKAYRDGYAYSGEYSEFRKRRFGNSTAGLAGSKFVVYSQNHDQVGNRMLGERLGAHISLEAQKVAAALVITSPYLPMLFMGEEYGEPAPFQYFVSHGDQWLIDAVRNGRKEEFASFAWQGEPPDPQSEETFLRSKLNPALRLQPPHAALYAWYRRLLALRKTVPELRDLSRQGLAVTAWEPECSLAVARAGDSGMVLLLANLGKKAATLSLDIPPRNWYCAANSRELQWGGPGEPAPTIPAAGGTLTFALPPESFLLYRGD